MRRVVVGVFIWSERRMVFFRGNLGDSETSWIELNLVNRGVVASSLIDASLSFVCELRRRIDFLSRQEIALSCLVNVAFCSMFGSIAIRSVSELHRFKPREVWLGTLPEKGLLVSGHFFVHIIGLYNA